MTDAERALWLCLRAHRLNGLSFRRQVPIGSFIVDFVCHDHKLVIELDGGHHAGAEAAALDASREQWLQSKGYHVLRLWNSEVLRQRDAVIQNILDVIAQSVPPSRHSRKDANDDLPLKGGGEALRGKQQ